MACTNRTEHMTHEPITMNNHKRIVLTFIIGLAILLLAPTSVSAHVLKTDGVIGAVMHIDPEDSPIAQEPATFFFEMRDKTGKFTSQACLCTVTINQGDKQLFSSPLFGTNQMVGLNTPSMTFAFPEPGTYVIDILGRPRNAGSFQAFDLRYDVRVERMTESTSAAVQKTTSLTQPFYRYAGLLFIILLFAFIAFIDHKRTKKDN